MGTLSLYEDAAVLTHQNTVRKDRRLHQGPQDFYMRFRLLLVIEMPLLGRILLDGIVEWYRRMTPWNAIGAGSNVSKDL